MKKVLLVLSIYAGMSGLLVQADCPQFDIRGVQVCVDDQYCKCTDPAGNESAHAYPPPPPNTECSYYDAIVEGATCELTTVESASFSIDQVCTASAQLSIARMVETSAGICPGNCPHGALNKKVNVETNCCRYDIRKNCCPFTQGEGGGGNGEGNSEGGGQAQSGSGGESCECHEFKTVEIDLEAIEDTKPSK